MRRGRLRIYLGAAPGVGKTYAMLGEGRRRAERGTDVIVGFVETHGRPHTADMVGELEVLPRARLTYRGATFGEMDLDALLARHPQVALVDELAHTNVPGSRHAKRWQDVDELLAAGIDVISTVNVQHLESLNDVVEAITGIAQQETVPDRMVRAADQIELVDMTPEALRRRLAHGNVYTPDKVDAALGNYFRAGNLTALRELALLWLADRVDEGLQRYRADHGIRATWEARERVVVALTGGPEGETLVRRAARIASRATADLLAVHVVRSDGLTTGRSDRLAAQRALVESLGGSYAQVVGEDVPTALLEFARAENATQLVLGASRRTRWQWMLTGPGIGARTVRESGPIDVHIVTHEHVGTGRPGRHRPGRLSARRRWTGWLLASVALPLLTLVLSSSRRELNNASQMLTYLLVVIVVAIVGGLWPALAAALAGSLLLNWYFTPPLHTFTIGDRNNAWAIGVFFLVAIAVSALVHTAARRTSQAIRSAAEADTLATLAGSVLHADIAVPTVLQRIRETFDLTSVTLLERTDEDWSVIAHVGSSNPATRPDAGDDVPVTDQLRLVILGGPLAAADRRVLAAFAAHAAALLDRGRLAAAAEAAEPIAEADRVRTALLTAVSHDLRTPLASAKAAVGSLRSTEVRWTEQEREELLATAEESLDRLTRLVENLLDLSRLQTGALAVFSRPVGLDEMVPRVLDELGAAGAGVSIDVPDTLPEILADPPLLERVLVNLLANALRHSPPNRSPALRASSFGDTVEVRVVDRGPGIPEAARERVFAPFQRLGDHDNSTGVGLGLALARGLVEAMHGTLTPDDTPGGGLTMIVSLPAAPPMPTPPPGSRERAEQEASP